MTVFFLYIVLRGVLISFSFLMYNIGMVKNLNYFSFFFSKINQSFLLKKLFFIGFGVGDLYWAQFLFSLGVISF